MVQVSGRTGFTGSALVRLLARLTDVDVAESSQSFSDRLSQWLRWTDAIALSSALDGPSAASVADDAGSPAAGPEAQAVACARVRATLARAIADDMAFLGDRRATPLDSKKSDFAPYRVRYHARQQAMEAGVASLRARVRAALADGSPAMARLAAVDAVMEQALGAQERSLLGSVPGLLEQHFRRMRQASVDSAAKEAKEAKEAAEAQEAQKAEEAEEHAVADVPPRPDSDAWQDAFCATMQAVMLAELEIRLQPVEGLLAALRPLRVM